MNKNIKKINTRTITLTIIFVLILIVIALLIGKFSYSYLAPTVSDDVEGSGEVTASGDTIIFTKGNTLSLSATTDNFKTNGENLTAATNPKVKLMASSKTNSASSTYYVGVHIKENNYTYSTTSKTPEIILTIKDEKGNEVTSVNGLTYTTSNGVSGFDVTNKSGLYDIDLSHTIATTSSSAEIIHTWTFTLTFINLETNQSVNENANMDIDVYLQKKQFPLNVADVCSGEEILSSCVTMLSQKSLSVATNVYHHDSSLTNGAGDNSYRYSGANPNNFVCFGSDDAVCPTENLYRIIGLIDGKIKLISADGATKDVLGTDGGYSNTYSGSRFDSSYYKGTGNLSKIGVYKWNSTGTNTWSSSTTNITNLNANYLTYLDGKNVKWKNMIDDTTWYVGGMSSNNGYQSNAKTAYDYETGTNKDTSTTESAKIGLMYLSEYYYGAAPDYWTLPGYNSSGNDYRKAKDDNWLYTGLYEWTLSRYSADSVDTFRVDIGGYVVWYYADISYILRPTFNLMSSIKYVSGIGTSDNPIRISL